MSAVRTAGEARKRPWSTAVAVGATTLLSIALLWLVVRIPMADAVKAGVTVPLFGQPLPTFRAEPQAMVDRAWLLVMFLGTSFAAMAGRRPRLLRNFLFAPGSPVDLAVLRVVVFGVLAVLPRVREAVQFSHLPSALRTPPAGIPWLLDVIPATPSVVAPVALAFVAACLLACVGLWTRPAAVTATVLGLYVLGVPQFYGKVTHYHHLWWIMGVLAVSRCGDALSLDAVRRSWRRGDGQPAVPGAAPIYRTPVRLVWLLIAITYLFPGAWKWVSAGPEWAFSDNVRSIMYEHWSRLPGYTPPLPIDRWPLAYMLGGVGIMVFEVTFILLLFDRRTRPLAVIAGLWFHNMNYVFLRLSFVTLQVCYVAFVPWDRLLRRVGRGRVPVEVVQAIGRGRRLVGALRVLDVLGVISSSDRGGPLTVRIGDRMASGWHAVRLLTKRLPLAWPLVPLTYAVPTGVGEQWLARSRTPTRDDPSSAVSATPTRAGSALVAAASVMIGANALAGVGGVTAAWPFAGYPNFAGIARTSRTELVLVVGRPGFAGVTLDAARLRDLVSWEKFDGMARPIVLGAEDAPERAKALVRAVEDAGVKMPPGTSIEVYSTATSLLPGARASDHLDLLLTLRF